MAEAARFSPLQRSPLDRLMNRWSLDTSPAYLAMDLMSRMVSPYSLNPLGHNPISDILEKSIDFAHLGEASIKLFITATNVHTGRGRVFRNKDITPDVLLASACLPTMFQAIEIDGEPYWDGGFVGNPTITPLVRESDALDVILVQINPTERVETPRTASQILNRLNEISFNSPLMKELRMIALLRQAADPGTGEGARWARMLMHRIVTDKLAEYGASSKLNAEGEFLAMLKEDGRPRRRRLPAARTATTSASGRPPTSTRCSRRSETMSESDLIGLLGILVGLGVLIWLAFRGWSVLLLAPIAAVVAALFARRAAARALDADLHAQRRRGSSPSSSRCSCSAPCSAS